MKVLQISSIEIVTAYQEFFGFELSSALRQKRVLKIENRFYGNAVLIV